MRDQFETESITMAMGVVPTLGAKPTLYQYQLRTAAGMEPWIQRHMQIFIATDDFKDSKDDPFDYDEVLALVSHGQTKESSAALFAAMPDMELATDIGIQVGRIVNWANTTIPREWDVDLSIVKTEIPDAISLSDFKRQWEVAIDPRNAVRDMEEGCLSDDQVVVLQTLWPAFYATMRQASTDAIIDRSAANKHYTIPSRKASQLRTLRQESNQDPSLFATAQAMFQERKQSKYAPAKPRRSGKPNAEGSTPGEKAASGGT